MVAPAAAAPEAVPGGNPNDSRDGSVRHDGPVILMRFNLPSVPGELMVLRFVDEVEQLGSKANWIVTDVVGMAGSTLDSR